ncbi:MAG: hypothetical protein K5870_01375, partial [Lachnospiraceae bacterium]|nr:hypothetical protein [Lachnospiraceae bacterium]
RGQTPIDANNNINVDVIRGGVDDVLKRLHGTDSVGAQSLDAIIQEISGERYQDTDDFTAKFIKGTVTAQDEYAGDTNDSGTGSLTFVSTYLTWLNSQSNMLEWEFANGSLLFQRQDYNTPLDWDQSETSDVYQIPEQAGMIVSSVDLARANLTGGKGSVGNGTQDYVTSSSDKDEDTWVPEQIAAKAEDGQAAAGIVDVQKDETNEPADGQIAAEDPASTAVTDSEAAPEEGQEPAADPENVPPAEPVSVATPEAVPAAEPVSEPAPAEPAPASEPAPAEPAPASEPEADAAPEAESEEPAASEAPAA